MGAIECPYVAKKNGPGRLTPAPGLTRQG